MGVSGAGSSTSKSSSSSSSRSSSSASKTSATKSATKSATTSKTANAQKKGTASRPTGYTRRDSFSLPECKVTPVKGGRTSSGTGVGNDTCTFTPRDSWEA